MFSTAFKPGALAAAGAVVAFAAVSASAAGPPIEPIGPFVGTMTEHFDYTSIQATHSLAVFGSAGALVIDLDASPGGAIKVEWSSQFLGKSVQAISSMMGGQLGVAEWTFDEPVARFGGYWNNNSGADDATVSFFDAGDDLIGVANATIPFLPDQGWTWNGWNFGVPIARVRVVGNGIENGFIWYDDMQADPAAPIGDLNGDGIVDGADLGILLASWGPCKIDCPADLDGDGVVDGADLGILLANWG